LDKYRNKGIATIIIAALTIKKRGSKITGFKKKNQLRKVVEKQELT